MTVRELMAFLATMQPDDLVVVDDRGLTELQEQCLWVLDQPTMFVRDGHYVRSEPGQQLVYLVSH